MSVIGPADASASAYGAMSQLIGNASNVSTALNTLTGQASSGRIANSYAGLGSGAATSLALEPAVAHATAWQANIASATGQMSVAQTALTAIGSIASNFRAQTNNLNGVDPAQIDSIAASARDALQQVAGLLNTQDGSIYVFAGQDSRNPPVPNASGILSSGFTTQIASAVAGLAVNGAAATASSTMAVATSNTPGTTPFSATLPLTDNGRGSVQTGQGQYTPTGILAATNSDIASTGSSTTGSYMRDILRGLATLGSLSGSQASAAGFADLVADVRTSLTGAVSALAGDQGVMGDRQTALTATGTQLADTVTALKTQTSGAEDVDMASTLSKLTQVQTQLQESYQVIAGLQNLSLSKYIGASG